jgi:hypothetical protein
VEGDEAEGTKGEFELVVTVVEARNLTSADYNGLSDPYAKLTVSSAVRKPDLPVQFLYACPPPPTATTATTAVGMARAMLHK